MLTPVGITWERRSQGRNQPSGVRPSQNRRRADRCGHHERHAGVLLRRLEPNWSITLIERLDAVAAESSGPWNNAGTGHSALCEMNYTPEMPDGSIDITKAVRVNEQFQVTRQFWAYAAENGILTDVRSFLNPVPHVSFVHGSRGVEYLRRRQKALAGNPLFAGTEFIESPDEFARRLPFMAAKRAFSEPVALNWAADGTDVDFGALAKQLIGYCVQNGTTALFGHEVRNLSRQSDGSWTVTMCNRRTGEKRKLNTKFVFVGAGVTPCRCCRNPGSKRSKASPASRLAVGSCAPGTRRSPPRIGQGIWLPGAGRPAVGRLASGSAVCQRQVVAGVRAIRRLVAEVLETRADQRPAPVDQAGQSVVRARRGPHRAETAELLDQPAASL